MGEQEDKHLMVGLELVERLRARIKELEAGACRFNCRKQKEAFVAGCLTKIKWANVSEGYEQEIAEEAYKEWRDEARKPSS